MAYALSLSGLLITCRHHFVQRPHAQCNSIVPFLQRGIVTSRLRGNGRIRLGDFRGALLGHAHMRRSRLCSTKICESNRNCIVFIKDDGSDGD